jgi:hypothetical protein
VQPSYACPSLSCRKLEQAALAIEEWVTSDADFRNAEPRPVGAPLDVAPFSPPHVASSNATESAR